MLPCTDRRHRLEMLFIVHFVAGIILHVDVSAQDDLRCTSSYECAYNNLTDSFEINCWGYRGCYSCGIIDAVGNGIITC